jgi:hypothetical protein
MNKLSKISILFLNVLKFRLMDFYLHRVTLDDARFLGISNL